MALKTKKTPSKKITENTETVSKASLRSKELVLQCASAAIDKKGLHTVIFEVGSLGAFTDYFLIASGMNEKQVQAMADEIVRRGKANGHGNARVEGYEQGRWILVDFGDVVIHLFHEYIREFYDLESLWAGAARIEIPQEYFVKPPAPSITGAKHA